MFSHAFVCVFCLALTPPLTMPLVPALTHMPAILCVGVCMCVGVWVGVGVGVSSLPHLCIVVCVCVCL